MTGLSVLTLENLIDPNHKYLHNFPKDFRPLELFHDYLKIGYYPFFMDDAEGYHHRLKQLVRLVVEYDMAEVKGFDIRNAKKMLQLLYLIAQQVPFKPNLIKLAERSKIHRNSLVNYFLYLEEARLIKLLYPSVSSIAILQKPEKLFFNNPNLAFALASELPLKGTIREIFSVSQLAVNHNVTIPKVGDFELDGKIILEIGGKAKGMKQIEGIENAFVVKDDIEFPAAKTIPLWMLGFLY